MSKIKSFPNNFYDHSLGNKLWITFVTLYANLADKMGLFLWSVIGLCALFLAAVLTCQNKHFKIWLFYYAIIFICGGATVAIFIETKLMADLVALVREYKQ